MVMPQSTNVLVQAATRGLGHRYVFGGAPSSGGWDCSSAVNMWAGHDSKLAIPGYAAGKYDGRTHGPVVIQWAMWNGLVTVKGPPSPGDLCIWSGIGGGAHIGVATDATHMISALNPSLGTIHSPIAGYGPAGVPVMFRRYTNLASAQLMGKTGGCLPTLGSPVLIAAILVYMRRRYRG